MCTGEPPRAAVHLSKNPENDPIQTPGSRAPGRPDSIDQADVSTAAHRTSDYVVSRDAAYKLEAKFVDSLFPELSFIGDFHSHPYSEFHDGVRSELDLERNGLYRFSAGDFREAKFEQEAEKTTGLALLLLSLNVTNLLLEATNIWTRRAVLDFSMIV